MPQCPGGCPCTPGQRSASHLLHIPQLRYTVYQDEPARRACLFDAHLIASDFEFSPQDRITNNSSARETRRRRALLPPRTPCRAPYPATRSSAWARVTRCYLRAAPAPLLLGLCLAALSVLPRRIACCLDADQTPPLPAGRHYIPILCPCVMAPVIRSSLPPSQTAESYPPPDKDEADRVSNGWPTDYRQGARRAATPRSPRQRAARRYPARAEPFRDRWVAYPPGARGSRMDEE